jgi:hypothetical protein
MAWQWHPTKTLKQEWRSPELRVAGESASRPGPDLGTRPAGRPTASARTLTGSLRIPGLMDELQSIAIEIGNVGGVIAWREVRAIGWLALVDAAGSDRCRVCGINSLVTHALDAEVETCLAHLALPKPDTRSDSIAGAVDIVTESDQVRDTLGPGT